MRPWQKLLARAGQLLLLSPAHRMLEAQIPDPGLTTPEPNKSHPALNHAAAAMYSFIITAKLNNTDLRAWHADVLWRINDYLASMSCCPGTGATRPGRHSRRLGTCNRSPGRTDTPNSTLTRL